MTTPAPVAVLEVVPVLAHLPEHGLARGQVGTVVELRDDDGHTYAELALAVERCWLSTIELSRRHSVA
jgi:hypothetical protein